MQSPIKLPLRQTPRPYQAEAVEWFVKSAQGKGIFADEMGLGKTGEVYLSWRHLGYPQPCIIIAGRNAQLAWLNQAEDWGCPKPVMIRGSQSERKALWAKHKTGFVTITRESLKRDLASGYIEANNFKTVIVDECHKDANRKTGNYKILKDLTKTSRYIMLTSGSVMRRGPQSLWGPLNIIRPEKYKSYWGFLDKYCDIDKGGSYGWEILGPKDTIGLQKETSSNLLMRFKKDVRKDMPPKIRDINSNVLWMSNDQLAMYNAIREDCIYEFKDGIGIVTASSLLAKLQRLRQVLVTPKLLDPQADYGSGIERIVEMFDDATSHHAAVFSPFPTALPYVRERLVDAGIPGESIVQLSGGLSVEELLSRITHFKQTRGVALCSIKYAESFDLIPANWGVFLGFEWDAWENMQAEDRLHRGEIKDPVNIYYLRYKDGIDSELILPALDSKVNNVMSVLRNLDAVRKMLQKKAGSS